MPAKTDFRFWLFGAAAAILAYQLFVPPIVGLADQGDFIRVIRPFGYGPEPTSVNLKYNFVPRRYVPDSGYRALDWEQPTSESLPVAAAILLNRLVSKDGSLNIEVVGFTHALLFLAAFASLLSAIQGIFGGAILGAFATLALTDVGYAAYWNSLYREPAACIALILLLAETIRICRRGEVSMSVYVRWTLWAILLIGAKPQYAPLALPLVLFLFRRRQPGQGLYAAAILGTAVLSVATIPKAEGSAATYNLIFDAVLPESKDPSADLKALGLDPRFAHFSGTHTWSEGTGFYEPGLLGVIGTRVTPVSVARFYLQRPARLWRHVHLLMRQAASLRPEFSGNFEQSAGYPPGARSHAFSLWSAIHEHVLGKAMVIELLLMIAAPLLALLPAPRLRRSPNRRWIEFAGLLASCGVLAFLAAAFGDARDNVKHMFLFNLLLDALVVTGIAFAMASARERFVKARSPITSVRRTQEVTVLASRHSRSRS